MIRMMREKIAGKSIDGYTAAWMIEKACLIFKKLQVWRNVRSSSTPCDPGTRSEPFWLRESLPRCTRVGISNPLPLRSSGCMFK